MRPTLACLLLAAMPALSLAQAPKPGAKVTYDDHLVPLLREHCYACHNPDKKSGGLVLNNYTALMQGGAGGEPVEAGNADASRLYQVMAHLEQPFMPPKAPKLPQEKIDLVKKWIDGGALENAGSQAKASAKPKVDLSLKTAAVGKPSGPPPMPGKLALEPVVKTARANAVTAIATSPWAPLWAVAGQKQVLLYHSQTLELLGVLPFPEGVPWVLKFSRNGQLLLAGGGRGAKAGRVVVWNVQTGERVVEVGEEFDTVLAADISSDQSRVALGGPSKMVRIYSTKDGKLEHEMKKHTDWVTALEFSPDGVLLATGDRNGGLVVWEANNGREFYTLRGHTACITDVSWRGDSNVLASSSEDGTIRLWEMENGNQVKNWGAHGGGALAVRFTHDGRLTSAGRDRVAKVWDQNGAQQKAFEAFPDVATRADFNHDGTRVAAGDWTGLIKVFDVKEGKPLGQLLANPPTVAEQLELAKKDLTAKKTASDQAQAAFQAAQAAATKAAADLAAAQKLMAEAPTAVKAANEAVAKAQQAAAQTQAALQALQASVPNREAAAKSLTEAAAKAQEAADKLKDNKELADFAAKAKELVAKANNELTAARNQVPGMTAAVKTAQDQVTAAQAALAKLNQDVAAAPKTVEARAAANKAAAEQAAKAKAAADAAAEVLKLAQAAVDKWTAAVAKK